MSKRTKGKKLVLVIGIALAVILVGSAWLSWDHVRFWWLFELLGNNDQGYSEYRHRETGIVMVKVPGGTFMMGSPESESGRRPDETQHEVAVNPFLIAPL